MATGYPSFYQLQWIYSEYVIQTTHRCFTFLEHCGTTKFKVRNFCQFYFDLYFFLSYQIEKANKIKCIKSTNHLSLILIGSFSNTFQNIKEYDTRTPCNLMTYIFNKRANLFTNILHFYL